MPNPQIPNRRSRRGAPPGNLNALKHAFYARQFKKADLAGLEDSDFDGLKDEIAMLRIYIRRLIQQGGNTSDLYETAGILRILCLATASGYCQRLLPASTA